MLPGLAEAEHFFEKRFQSQQRLLLGAMHLVPSSFLLLLVRHLLLVAMHLLLVASCS